VISGSIPTQPPHPESHNGYDSDASVAIAVRPPTTSTYTGPIPPPMTNTVTELDSAFDTLALKMVEIEEPSEGWSLAFSPIKAAWYLRRLMNYLHCPSTNTALNQQWLIENAQGYQGYLSRRYGRNNPMPGHEPARHFSRQARAQA